MWRRLTRVAALVVLAAAPARAAHLRSPGEDLVQVVSPPSRGTANAHPDVNVVVSFGTAKDGTPADPTTFRARVRGKSLDVTPIMTGGVQTGARAVLPAALVRLGRALRNRVRLSVQGVRAAGEKGRVIRDIDRLRFGAVSGTNTPPTASADADADIVVLGTPVTFDASGSSDPDVDPLTFTWSFSDGTTADGATVAHTWAQSADPTVSATVHVSDGQATTDATLTLPVKVETDPGRTPGILRIEATDPLEFSVVATGATATRTLTIRNADDTPTSQLKVTAAIGAPFQVAPETLDLGPSGSATLTITFAPGVEGHADTRLVLTASASNRGAVSFIAHGYGGTGGGDGPTYATTPILSSLGSDLTRIAPDGGSVLLDDSTGQCAPAGGAGTGDVCVASGDCATSGEVCGPGGPVDITELCSDGQSVFLISEETFTDPRDNPDTVLSGTLLRLDLDASGTVTGREVLYRTTEDTEHLACDGVAGGQGGLVYVSEVRAVNGGDTCDRDDRDALVSINKSTGSARAVPGFARIDAAAGVGDCDFRDGVDRLIVSPDGGKKYAGFEVHGLYRIGPTPIPYTPDVSDRFDVHPDGSVVIGVAHDRGVTGSIDLYRMNDQEVEHGALPLASLTPCASFTLPNDSVPNNQARTVVGSVVVVPAASGDGAIALVTFFVSPQYSAFDVLPPFGSLRGTAAFALPSGTTACATKGLVSLQARDLSR
jgi:hypothetical protein